MACGSFVLGHKLQYVLRNVLVEVQFAQVQRLDHRRLVEQQQASVSSDLVGERVQCHLILIVQKILAKLWVLGRLADSGGSRSSCFWEQQWFLLLWFGGSVAATGAVVVATAAAGVAAAHRQLLEIGSYEAAAADRTMLLLGRRGR